MKRIAPVLVVLAIPLMASALGLLAREQWDARWKSGLEREFVIHGQRANPSVMARYSLGTLCGDPKTAARIPPCRTYKTFSAAILMSGVTAAAGLVLLGGILTAGASARRSRKFLVSGFRPVLYVVTGTLVLLLVAHALLGLQVMRLLSIVAGVRLAGLLTVLTAVALALVIGASAIAVRVARGARGARRLLAAAVDDAVAAEWIGALGTGPPGHPVMVDPDGPSPSGPAPTSQSPRVVVGLVPDVFVAPPGSIGIDGRLAEPVLHIPLTLAGILTGAELGALVLRARARAAEDGGAAQLMTESWSAVAAEHAAARRAGGIRAILALPMLSVLTLLLEACADAEAALERQLQVSADRIAAEASGARICGLALMKAAAFGPAWFAAVREMGDAVRSGSQYPNARALFTEIVLGNRDAARVAAVVHPEAATPPSSAPLRRRLEQLGLVPEDLLMHALEVPPPEPALRLVRVDLTDIEERLTTVVHLQILHASRG